MNQWEDLDKPPDCPREPGAVQFRREPDSGSAGFNMRA
jgi:hypothetical protein